MKYKDLPVNAGGTFIFCRLCGERFSATKGDYFLMNPDETILHCDEPMILAREQRRIYRIDVEGE